MTSLVLKNTTDVLKNWGGVDVPASGQYQIIEVDRLRLLSDAAFIIDLIAQNAIINDTIRDLSFYDAIPTLRGTEQTFSVKSVPENNRILIKQNEQLIVKQYMRVDGLLVVQGELVII